MVHTLLAVAAVLQGIAVVYGLYLLGRRSSAAGAWVWLLGAMLSMLTWRLFVLSGYTPPPFFNPLIAIWGSTCMVAAMFLFGREVAARQRAEAERDALLESERAARAESERASRTKDEFLATLSHELRSPLAAIIGWCAVLRRTRGLPPDAERGVTVIERNARAQSRLVDDLLDVTRMQSGGLHLDLERLPLDAPIAAAVQAARPMAEAKSVQLAYTHDPHSPAVVGDADRLQQIATNLIVNAVKFTPAGGRVDVEVRRTDADVQLLVTDTGEGIAPSFLPHVFTRFRQADGSSTRRHGGLGLGLSIVDHLVRLHGGTVRAESDGPGHGSRFVVTLPRVAADDVPPVGDEATTRTLLASTGQPLEGVRILLVDDEEDVRSAVARLLEQFGAEVTSASSGAGIASMLRERRPDVLLLDVGMPDEDGYSLIRRVRDLPAGAGDTPAISLTAHARNEDRARALAAGFDEHLPKPVDVPHLVAAIRRLTAARGVEALTAAK